MAEVSEITGQVGNKQALAFAAKGGKELSTLLGNIATRKEQERMGPIEMFVFLDTHFSDEEGIAIPVVGSKQGETGNLPFDKYTNEVQTKDGKKKVPASWFTDVIRATDEYAAIQERKAFCDDVTLPGCPDDIANMGHGERAVEKERLSRRVSDMRTALTRGAMLFHHVAEIEALHPDKIEVKLPVRKRKDTGELEVFGNSIRLIDPSKEIEDKVLSVSQFNALRPNKLTGKKEDWTITALEKTGDRAPKTKGGKGKQQTMGVLTTVEGFLTALNVMATSIDTQTDQGSKLNAALLTACAAKGEKGDDVVETIGDFAIAIDVIWSSINARYNGIKASKAAAMNVRPTKEKATA